VRSHDRNDPSVGDDANELSKIGLGTRRECKQWRCAVIKLADVIADVH
jgi:hypothetical protein